MAANQFAFDTQKSHHEVLNAHRNATSEDIEKEQALPDKAGERGTELFQKLVVARDTLLKKFKRAEYDDEHEDESLVEAQEALPCGKLIDR